EPGFTAFLQADPAATPPTATSAIPGNNILPGVAGNPFTTSLGASYSVVVLNNRADTGGVTDTDSAVLIRSTGYGPDGAKAVIEWEVRSNFNFQPSGRPCPAYG